MAEQEQKTKNIEKANMLAYLYLGGLKLNRLLKKTKHKHEQESLIKKDYIRLCIKYFFSSWKTTLFYLILFLIAYKFANANMEESNLAFISMLVFIPLIISALADGFANQRKEIRSDIIYEICENCGEYDNWERNEELVDKEEKLESDIEYHDSTIHGRSGNIYVSTPVSVLHHVTYYTYYVTRKCNCCGQIYYHYETR